MKELTIKIPDNMLNEFQNLEEQFYIDIFNTGLKQLKIKKFLNLFKENKISFGKAAQISGLPEDEFSIIAKANGLKPDFDAEMINEELGCV